MTDDIARNLVDLSPKQLVSFFVIDLEPLGGVTIYLHPGVNGLNNAVVWQGQEYAPFPIDVTGFDRSARGQIPRPRIRSSNVDGLLAETLRVYDDGIGAQVTRKRTLVKYLDAVNFPGSVNPTADPNAHFPDDVFYIARKVSENPVYVEVELAAAFDVAGIMLPRRTVLASVCAWGYRSPECSYAGPPVADINDDPTSDPLLDQCSKHLTGCELRFGEGEPLPFGAFPSSLLVRR